NDYYFGDPDDGGKGPPLGNLQLLGKLREPMLRGAMPGWMPRAVGRAMTAHARWVRKASAIIKKAGYPVVLTKPLDITTPSHQCGTVRFGNDPATSALDTMCKAW